MVQYDPVAVTRHYLDDHFFGWRSNSFIRNLWNFSWWSWFYILVELSVHHTFNLVKISILHASQANACWKIAFTNYKYPRFIIAVHPEITLVLGHLVCIGWSTINWPLIFQYTVENSTFQFCAPNNAMLLSVYYLSI